MKKFLILLFVSMSTFVNAQRSVNDYKYAVVPNKFDFSREADQYKLNTYTKMYMEKYGFTAYLQDEVPMELADSNCNKIYVDVLADNSMFATKLIVVLKDCQNNILYKSAEGVSRDKTIKVAYQQALREAFNSFDKLNYKFSGSEIVTLQPKETPAVATTTMTIKPISNEAAAAVLSTAVIDTKELLFAQPIPNGFQIVDTTPKVILKLKVTSKPDVFIAERDSVTGLLFNANGKWVFEYYLQGKLVSESLTIKF